MKIRDYCLPCLVNQVVKVAHMSHAQNKEELYHQVFDYLSSLDFELTNPEINIAIRARVLSLLTKIFAIFREASGTSRGKEGQVQEIIRYINQNLSAPLTLEGLARTFYMSKNHLTAVFKRATGTTVARYILYKRMAIVRKELAMGVPAAEAASRAGFGDYSRFFQGIQKNVWLRAF